MALLILVACEESQRVTTEFRKLGHNAFSCDIQDCSGGHPEWHIKQDVLPLINGNCEFTTCDGAHRRIIGTWDIIIAHPDCTYLTVTGNRWFNEERYGEKARERKQLREKAAAFFMEFANADCDHIAIENPVGYMSTFWRKPDQIIQPTMFGDPFEKKTCLWLKGLPNLEPRNEVEAPPRQEFPSGKTMPLWYSRCGSGDDRRRNRSKTFPGFAAAMAEQWSRYVEGTK